MSRRCGRLRRGRGRGHCSFTRTGSGSIAWAELKSMVNVLHWNAPSGGLETVQEGPLLPKEYAGETAAADIVLDKAGRFAYVANRLDDFLATFTVSSTDGRLTDPAGADIVRWEDP